MPVAERLRNEAPALSERELEVLRLLAGGHTVKSIAARLGRTEASIHERLRDARRKAGANSSRELARRIAEEERAAQKNRDRKIDLAGAACGADPVEAPSRTRRFSSKGQIAMLAIIPALAAAVLVPLAAPGLVPVAAEAPGVQASPLAGTWSLDVDRIPPEERPRSVTITFAPATDGRWSTRVAIVAADGSSSEATSTAALDGKPVPVSGTMPFVDSASLRQPSADTIVLTLAKDGRPVSTRVYTAARDGRSMTETIVWPGPGVPGLETTYFTKVG